MSSLVAAAVWKKSEKPSNLGPMIVQKPLLHLQQLNLNTQNLNIKDQQIMFFFRGVEYSIVQFSNYFLIRILIRKSNPQNQDLAKS